MSVYSEDTNLLRTHYYISSERQSIYDVQVRISGNHAFFNKDVRGHRSVKFTHVNMMSLLRVLAFSYMGFQCVNIDDLMNNAMSMMFVDNEEERIVVTTPHPGFYVERKGVVEKAYLASKCIMAPAVHEEIRERNLWPFGEPIIERLPHDDNLFSYTTVDSPDLCHFVKFVSRTFKSDQIATLLQNPLLCIFEEIKVKHYEYLIFNNIQLLQHSLFPSVYDYLTGECILNYIKSC